MTPAKHNSIGLPDRLPPGWATQPIKRQYQVELGKMLQSEPTNTNHVLRPYLRAANVTSHGIDVSDVREMWFTPSEWRRTRLAPGDLLISEGGDVGRPAVWDGELTECGIQNALNRARSVGHLSNMFLLYVLTSLRANGAIDVVCNKATIPHFTAEKVGATIIPVPPVGLEELITAHIDAETSRVDALINRKQRFIELLLEKRTALVAHTVTKGLDPTVELKHSGAPWFGSVPAHWPIVRLGYFARISNGSTPSRNEPDYWINGTVPWMSSAKVNEDRIIEPSELITEKALRECSISVILAGSVVIGLIGQGRTRGTVALLTIDATINQNMAAIISYGRVHGRYLQYQLTNMYAVIREYGRGGNQAALNCALVADLRLPLPEFSEQAAIAGFLDAETSKIDTLVNKTASSVALLSEYRTALITAAVTGQIDIPGTETTEEVA